MGVEATDLLMIERGGALFKTPADAVAALNVSRGASVSQIFRPLAGSFIGSAPDIAALGTLAQVANTIRIFPFMSPIDMPIDQAGVSVSTLLAAALSKVVVYNSDALGRPDTLAFETGNIDGSTTGTKVSAVSFTFLANRLYWVGTNSNSAVTLRTIGSTGIPALGWSNTSNPVPNRCLSKTETYGPSGAWGSYTNAQLNTTAPPFVIFRVA